MHACGPKCMAGVTEGATRPELTYQVYAFWVHHLLLPSDCTPRQSDRGGRQSEQELAVLRSPKLAPEAASGSRARACPPVFTCPGCHRKCRPSTSSAWSKWRIPCTVRDSTASMLMTPETATHSRPVSLASEPQHPGWALSWFANRRALRWGRGDQSGHRRSTERGKAGAVAALGGNTARCGLGRAWSRRCVLLRERSFPTEQ